MARCLDANELGDMDVNKSFSWPSLALAPVDLEEDCIWNGVIWSSIGGDIEVMPIVSRVCVHFS